MIKEYLLKLGRRFLSKNARLRLLHSTRWPPVNHVRFGQLRRVEPISRQWGGDRGKPVDRHYIERFLSANAADIKGHVLEVGDNRYTLAFGGARVTKSEVVHASGKNPMADYVADFVHAPQLPSATFDHVICTQTLQLVSDLPAAIATLYRILKPEGVLLVTVPGISQIYLDKKDRWKDYWRFTGHAANWLFRQVFPAELVTVDTYGNVLAAIAFLHGLAAEELTDKELAHHDELYPVVVGVRAQKPSEAK
jgi:SAM-dependent methyltransferase